ncbi:MAG: hypothetical protein HC772_09795 [Leptolyngbyaceae cyanobacterium CRU_2_3]|nr:hypothetical protein [Leptolyngbyaceae cyanobacterium CRU_2_3]
MASTTVAPVESYTSDSIAPTPDNYAQFGVKTQVAVNLVDSDLWLVDSSKLAAQMTDTSASVTLLDWTVKSQTTVPLENVTAVDQPVNFSASSQGDFSQYLSSDLPLDSMLQLSAVSGSVQFGNSASGSGLSSSSGFTSGDTSSSISTTSFQSEGDGSGSSIPSFGSSGGTPTSSTTETSSTPSDGSSTPSTTSSGTPSITSSETSSRTPELTSSSTSTSTDQLVPNSPPNAVSNPPVPVPFDFASSLGLVVLIITWGGGRMMRFWHSQLRLKHQS